ncbi:MAG: sensor histidine kinase [Vulcanimicrobiota bacterium]
MIQDLTALGLLVAAVAWLVKTGLGPAAPALLAFALMALALDLVLLQDRESSRTSVVVALAMTLLGPAGGVAGLVVSLVGALALLSTGKQARALPSDLFRSVAPLAAGVVVAIPLEGLMASLSACLGFALAALALEPRRPLLRLNLLTLVCAPGLALAILELVELHLLLLLLVFPLLVAAGRGRDEAGPLLGKLRRALQHSQLRQQEASQRAQRLSVLLKAANLMSTSLEPEKLRSALARAIQGCGVTGRVYLAGEQPPQGRSLELPAQRGVLLLESEPSATQEELLRILGRIFSTCWENAELHQQVVEALEETRRSQAQLVQSSRMAAMGRLAAGVAHEVNTPLGAIQLSAEVAQRYLPDQPERARERLEAIVRSTENARKSVQRLLHYARPAEPEARERFAVAEVIADTLDLLDYRIERVKANLTVDCHADAQLEGNRHQFFSLLSNLVLNAIEAVADSDERQVHIAAHAQPDQLQLTVEDSGPGVPAELREQVFEPFFTTRPSGEGTGLGLFLASQAAAEFGGQLVCGASPLGGASFSARFPIVTNR